MAAQVKKPEISTRKVYLHIGGGFRDVCTYAELKELAKEVSQYDAVFDGAAKTSPPHFANDLGLLSDYACAFAAAVTPEDEAIAVHCFVNAVLWVVTGGKRGRMIEPEEEEEFEDFGEYCS
jgi:hypothetical protein